MLVAKMTLLRVFLESGSTFVAVIKRSAWVRCTAFFRQKEKTHTESENAPNASAQKRKFVISERGSTSNIVIRDKPSIPQRDTLFLSANAFAEIQNHISWGRKTPENINEQGGLLLGMRCETPTDRNPFVVVTHALPIRSNTTSSAYIKFDHEAWHRVLTQLDMLKDQRTVEPETNIIGWYHTHPQQLDCFMSGTDRTTQRSTFYQAWNYALVLNPQRKIVKCFVGGEAVPCPVAIFA
jgi:proteasome lid subunit RPN8/RPN11